MPAFQTINGTLENLAHGNFDLATDQLVLVLSPTAPSAEVPRTDTLAANATIANVSDIVLTNLSGDLNVTTVSSSQTSGVYTLVIAQKTIEASGGALPTWRYCYLASSTTGFLIGYWDYGEDVDIGDGESVDCIPTEDPAVVLRLQFGVPA